MKNRIFVYVGLFAGAVLLVALFAVELDVPVDKSYGTRIAASGNSVAVSSSPLLEPEALRDRLKLPVPPLLIDVREPSERVSGVIDGDINIPLGLIEARAAELPKDRPIVVYCRSGRRSAQAVTMLQALGFQDVKSLTGGFQAWGKGHPCAGKAC